MSSNSGFKQCPHCNRKYKRQEVLDKHITKVHGISDGTNPAPTTPQNLFYLCTELGCNKKYKGKYQLEHHFLHVHSMTDPVIGDPIHIDRNNRKALETNRNRNRELENREQLIKDIEEKKRLEEVARIQALSNYQESVTRTEILRLEQEERNRLERMERECLQELENIERLKREKEELEKSIAEEAREQMREEKERLEKEQVELLRSKVELEKERQESTTCTICFDADVNATMVPCGHQRYCYECADQVFKSYNKVCPHCRTEIMMVMKTFK